MSGAWLTVLDHETWDGFVSIEWQYRVLDSRAVA